MWSVSDDTALMSIFDFVWFCWNAPFQVLGYTTSFWKLTVTIFVICLVFKIARGLFEF